MRTEVVGENIKIYFESQHELEVLSRWEAEACRLMPNLARVWRTELQMVSGLGSLIEMMPDGMCFISLGELVKTGSGTPIVLDARATKGKAGRPLDARIIQASLKLLLLAPYEIFLEQEKKWRREKYFLGVRDKCVKDAMRKAEYSAVRDANMCVARAQRLVYELFHRHPEMLIPYTILCGIAKDWHNKN